MQFSNADLEAAKRFSDSNGNKNYYDLLNIKKDADLSTIKKAYRKLVLEYHPDKTKGDEAKTQKFTQISTAYEILSDEERRNGYDNYLSGSSQSYSAKSYQNDNNKPSHYPREDFKFDYHGERSIRLKKEADVLINKLATEAASFENLVDLATRLGEEDPIFNKNIILDALIKFLSQSKLDEVTQNKLSQLRLNEPIKVEANSYSLVFQALMQSPNQRATNPVAALADLAQLIQVSSAEVSINLFKFLITQTNDPKQSVALRIKLGKELVKQKGYKEAFDLFKEAKSLNCQDEDTLGDLDIAVYQAISKCQLDLYYACERADMDTVKEYLSFEGVHPKASLIIASTKSKSLEMVHFIYELLQSDDVLYKDFHGWTAAHYAASSNSVDILAYFWAKNQKLFDITTSPGIILSGQQSVLLIAVNNNSAKAITFLAEKKPGMLDLGDQRDWTPLNTAYKEGNFPLFIQLLKLGANPNGMYTPSTKETILHRATYDNQVTFVNALLSTGKIEITANTKGQTPIHLAKANTDPGWGFFKVPEEATDILKALLAYSPARNAALESN